MASVTLPHTAIEQRGPLATAVPGWVADRDRVIRGALAVAVAGLLSLNGLALAFGWADAGDRPGQGTVDAPALSGTPDAVSGGGGAGGAGVRRGVRPANAGPAGAGGTGGGTTTVGNPESGSLPGFTAPGMTGTSSNGGATGGPGGSGGSGDSGGGVPSTGGGGGGGGATTPTVPNGPLVTIPPIGDLVPDEVSDLPVVGPIVDDVVDTADPVIDDAEDTANDTAGTVVDTVDDATGTVTDTVGGVTTPTVPPFPGL